MTTYSKHFSIVLFCIFFSFLSLLISSCGGEISESNDEPPIYIHPACKEYDRQCSGTEILLCQNDEWGFLRDCADSNKVCKNGVCISPMNENNGNCYFSQNGLECGEGWYILSKGEEHRLSADLSAPSNQLVGLFHRSSNGEVDKTNLLYVNAERIMAATGGAQYLDDFTDSLSVYLALTEERRELDTQNVYMKSNNGYSSSIGVDVTETRDANTIRYEFSNKKYRYAACLFQDQQKVVILAPRESVLSWVNWVEMFSDNQTVWDISNITPPYSETITLPYFESDKLIFEGSYFKLAFLGPIGGIAYYTKIQDIFSAYHISPEIYSRLMLADTLELMGTIMVSLTGTIHECVELAVKATFVQRSSVLLDKMDLIYKTDPYIAEKFKSVADDGLDLSLDMFLCATTLVCDGATVGMCEVLSKFKNIVEILPLIFDQFAGAYDVATTSILDEIDVPLSSLQPDEVCQSDYDCVNGQQCCIDYDHFCHECCEDSHCNYGWECREGVCAYCMVSDYCASRECSDGDVWCYDNCGNPNHKDKECGIYSCSVDECTGCQVTNSCASRKCVIGDVYCYDNCGNLTYIDEECGSDGCSGEECNECRVTDDCASKDCYNSDVWCYDNCGNPNHKDEECGSDECSGDECLSSNGSWYDSNTGLYWEDPPSSIPMYWEEADKYCRSLTLDGYDDWYLPSISELRSLIRGCSATESGGDCNIYQFPEFCREPQCRSSSCDGCSLDDGPAHGCYWPSSLLGSCGYYWSSSLIADDDDLAWCSYYRNGYINTFNIYSSTLVRCVRW